MLTVGTNSYVTLQEAEVYFSTRIESEPWNSLSETAKESAIVTATTAIDDRDWLGFATEEQLLAWPRSGVGYYDRRMGRTVSLKDDVIPDRVKNAVLEQALHLVTNSGALTGSASNYESISIGPISLTDNNSGKTIAKTSSLSTKQLSPLVRNTRGGNIWWRAN